MSVQAMSWVFDHSMSEGTHRLVMLSIANHAGARGGSAWPNRETISGESRVSVSTVKRAIRDAEEAGELLVYPGAGVSEGRNKPNRYEMPLVPGWAPPPLTPRCDPHSHHQGGQNEPPTGLRAVRNHEPPSNLTTGQMGADDGSNGADGGSQLRPANRPSKRPSKRGPAKPDWADRQRAALEKRMEDEQKAGPDGWDPAVPVDFDAMKAKVRPMNTPTPQKDVDHG